MKRKHGDIQKLYDTAEQVRNRQINAIETKYKERLIELDKMVDTISDDSIEYLKISWEREAFGSSIAEIFNKKEEGEGRDYITLPHYNITNQFNQDYYKLSKLNGAHNSCVPISLMFCYYYIDEDGDVDKTTLKRSMKQGAVLYNEWKLLNKNILHPTIVDILNLKECRPFHNTVKNNFERGGLFKIIDEEYETSLSKHQKPTFKELIFEIIQLFNKNVNKICIITGIKKHYFISIIITNPEFPKNISKQEKLKYIFDIFLFDSHGSISDNGYIDYIKLNNINNLINFISKQYNIGCIKDAKHQEQEGKNMKEFDFYSKYGYTSFVFY